MNKEELKDITDEVIDNIVEKLKEQVEETENKQQELTKKGNSRTSNRKT